MSIAALAGLVLMAVGQTLLIVGRLSLDGSYVTGGVGVIPFIAWIVLLAVLALGLGVLPGRTGWLAVATLVTIVALSVIAAITLGPPAWVARRRPGGRDERAVRRSGAAARQPGGRLWPSARRRPSPRRPARGRGRPAAAGATRSTPGIRPRFAIGRPSISLMSPVKSIGVAPLMYDPTANESTGAPGVLEVARSARG